MPSEIEEFENRQQQRRSNELGADDDIDIYHAKPGAENDGEETDETEDTAVEEDDLDDETSGRRLSKRQERFAEMKAELAERDAAIAERDRKLMEFEEREKSNQPFMTDDQYLAKAQKITAFDPKWNEQQKTQALQNSVAYLKELYEPFQAKLNPNIPTEEVLDAVDEHRFNREWRSFSRELLGQYRNASPQQMELARDAMDELAHAPQFSDKEFDYVYFKNRDIFNEIFARRITKSFESRDENRFEYNDREESNGNLPKDPQKRAAFLEAEMRKQDTGMKVHNPI